MDPVSLALGIAGVLPLIAKAIKCAKEYSDAVRTAKDSVAALVRELEALQLGVSNLQQFLKCDALARDHLRFEQTSVLLSCSTACEARLRSLCRKLGEEDGGRRSRCLWPFSEKEHQKTLQEIRNFTNWMHFALSLDGCRLLSRTSDDVLKLLGQQLEHFKTIQSLEETAARISGTVQDQKLMLEGSLAQDARRQILDWVSTTKYYQKHLALQASRTRNTGDWILCRPEYVKWRDSPDQADAVLWCHGIQGSEKTNLVSIIVDSLLSLAPSPPQAVVYYYFDHQDQSAHSPTTVFSCILRQLLARMPSIPKAVSTVYDKSKGGLPQSECERLITELSKEFDRVYVVIDALDECAPQHRTPVVQTLGTLSKVPGVRLLLTSRPYVSEIAAACTHGLHLKVAARDQDIRLYIREELARSGIFGVEDEQFARDLIQRLTQGADGMFLLPVLQLRTILNEPTLGEMEDSLNNLSHSLTEAFEETISRIQRLPASRSRIGMETLMYLSHAARPMAVHELRDLLAIHAGHRRVNGKYRPTEKMILDCCQGLVTIEAETGHASTCHYSVKEYLLENDPRLFPRAESIFATKCLGYIMLEDFSAGPWETEEEIESHSVRYAFLPYAARWWGTHAKRSEDDGEVQAALADFFGSTRAMATANQVRQYSAGYVKAYWAPEECLSFTALHHACRHGLTRTVESLLSAGVLEVNVATTEGSTPIIHAAANGHAGTVRLLMQRGADPYLCNWYGNALHCAVEGGHASTVRELVTGWGMDPRDAGNSRQGYLSCALPRDADKAFEALVELGVDMHTEVAWAPTGSGGTADIPVFLAACARGCYKIVGLMIDRGWADVNMRSQGAQTALHWALRRRNFAIAQRLVEAGADINAAGDDGVSPLDLIRLSIIPRRRSYLYPRPG